VWKDSKLGNSLKQWANVKSCQQMGKLVTETSHMLQMVYTANSAPVQGILVALQVQGQL